MDDIIKEAEAAIKYHAMQLADNVASAYGERYEYDLIARLLTALKEAHKPGDGWRPIETAPKDGKFILVAVADGWLAEDNMSVAKWDGSGWRYCDEGESGYDGYFANPTHWQPLPAAPTTEGSNTIAKTGE